MFLHERSNKNDPRQSLSINVIVFTAIGVWMPENTSKWKHFYNFYSILILGVFYTSFLISLIVYMMDHWGDIEEMVSVLFLMVTILGEYVKIYPFIFKPEVVKSILNELIGEHFQPTIPKQEEILKIGMYTVKKNCIGFTSMCVATVSIWGIYPILDGTTEIYRLPAVAWIPFDINRSPQYQIAYIYVIAGILMSAIVNAMYDTFISGLMIHAKIQFDILADSLENIKILNEHVSGSLEEEHYFLTKIISCIKHHHAILQFISNFETLFCYASLAEFCAAGFVLVVTLFQITLVSPITFQFVMLASYLTCILYQLFIYCWYGNEIILKSIHISEAAYNSDWNICGYKKYRQMLLILMIRLQTPVEVKAGKFIPLSLPTYTTILRSAWSYFTMLRQVHDN